MSSPLDTALVPTTPLCRCWPTVFLHRPLMDLCARRWAFCRPRSSERAVFFDSRDRSDTHPGSISSLCRINAGRTHVPQ